MKQREDRFQDEKIKKRQERFGVVEKPAKISIKNDMEVCFHSSNNFIYFLQNLTSNFRILLNYYTVRQKVLKIFLSISTRIELHQYCVQKRE